MWRLYVQAQDKTYGCIIGAIMAYKDKDRQREANKQASQRRRDRAKGMTAEGVTPEGMTQLKPTTDTRSKAKCILDGWAEGNGSQYQQDLANLGRQYSIIKGQGAGLEKGLTPQGGGG